MYNWSTDTTRIAKNSTTYEKFKLENMINFGLNNGKISLKLLKKHWDILVIDTDKKKYLKKLVWAQS
jgi:hypothetical protein